MTGEIEWPSDGWKTVSLRPPKAVKPPPPDACIGVGGKGIVTLSLSRALIERLGWKMTDRIDVRAIEEEARVFLSLLPLMDAAFGMSAPPKWSGEGLPGRLIVRMYRLGGIALSPRRTAGVAHVVTGGVLQLAVPRAGDGVQPDKPPEDAPADKAAAFDIPSLAAFAVDAAMKSWPSRISPNDQRVRVAAAVALVEFGIDLNKVREQLDLGRFLLPDREDMPRPAGPAATAALEALREATEDE